MKKVILFLALAALAYAECPNACSGHGTCCTRDMCTCYAGFTGNDCSMEVCPYGITHARVPSGDIDSDGTVSDLTPYSTDLAPETVYELYGSWSNNEHAGYYECSQKGLCDRETGECECFPGYSGAACQRASCPDTGDGVCSGHGVCRSMRDLGRFAEERSFTYSLWDQDATMGCDCDAGYSGPSCAERECPVGVDPLYTGDGHPVFMRLAIQIGADVPVSGDYRLKVYDVHGEDYITEPILAEHLDVSYYGEYKNGSCAAVVSAFTNLPNGAINSGLTCSAYSDPTLHGVEYELRFSGTPGALRTPEVYENNLVGANSYIKIAQFGAVSENTDRITTALLDSAGNIDKWSVIAGSTALTSDVGSSIITTTLAAPRLAKIGDEHIVLSALPTANSATSKWPLDSGHSGKPLFYSGDTLTIGALGGFNCAFGSKNATIADSITQGATIFVENQRYVAQTGGRRVTLDRNFGGKPLTRDDATVSDFYTVTLSTTASEQYTYVSQCANRGICDTETGLCECHQGYKGAACDLQVAC